MHLQSSFAPVTFEVGFLEAPFEAVTGAIAGWRRALGVPLRELQGTEATAGLAQLEPVTLSPRRELVLATRSAWTAYLSSSLVPGTSPAVGYLAEQLATRGCTFLRVPRGLLAKGFREGTGFALYGPVSTPTPALNCVRSLRVLKDMGKWRFEEHGEPQAFEDVARYSARKIADRLTPDMATAYARALGIELDEPSFYGPQWTLLVNERPLTERAYTFREAMTEYWGAPQ
jgi:hypothetical protein